MGLLARGTQSRHRGRVGDGHERRAQSHADRAGARVANRGASRQVVEGDREMKWLVIAAIAGLLLADGRTCAAQDAAVVSPDIYKVEIDNQWVRVLRVKLAPHQKSEAHTQPEGVAVLLTD